MPAVIENRRKRLLSDQIQWWINFISSWLAGVPLILEPLRQVLPTHYYGVLAFGIALANFSIAHYQKYKQTNPVPVDADEVRE